MLSYLATKDSRPLLFLIFQYVSRPLPRCGNVVPTAGERINHVRPELKFGVSSRCCSAGSAPTLSPKNVWILSPVNAGSKLGFLATAANCFGVSPSAPNLSTAASTCPCRRDSVVGATKNSATLRCHAPPQPGGSSELNSPPTCRHPVFRKLSPRREFPSRNAADAGAVMATRTISSRADFFMAVIIPSGGRQSSTHEAATTFTHPASSKNSVKCLKRACAAPFLLPLLPTNRFLPPTHHIRQML